MNFCASRKFSNIIFPAKNILKIFLSSAVNLSVTIISKIVPAASACARGRFNPQTFMKFSISVLDANTLPNVNFLANFSITSVCKIFSAPVQLHWRRGGLRSTKSACRKIQPRFHTTNLLARKYGNPKASWIQMVCDQTAFFGGGLFVLPIRKKDVAKSPCLW